MIRGSVILRVRSNQNAPRSNQKLDCPDINHDLVYVLIIIFLLSLNEESFLIYNFEILGVSLISRQLKSILSPTHPFILDLKSMTSEKVFK